MSAQARLAGKRLVVAGVRWPAETFITRKLVGLRAAGLDVVVAASNPGRAGRGADGIEVARLPQPVVSREASLAGLTAFAREAALWASHAGQALRAARAREPGRRRFEALRARRFAFLVGLEPDLVHFEWNTAAIEFLPCFDGWSCPFVVSCRGSQVNIRAHVPGHEDYLRDLARVFERASAVHCVSQAIRDEAIALGLRAEKAAVIRPAVPSEFFMPMESSETTGPFRILSVGGIEWNKANELALCAVRRLVDRGIDARYTIIGSGEESLRLLYTIRDLGLERRVEWLGRQEATVVRDRLQHADVFLLTSYSEGIANVALEAMSCAVPVVTSDAGGMREAVTDGVEGFVVPIRDLDATVAALGRLAGDGRLRGQMGAAARRRVLAEFSLERQIGELLRLYDGVLSNGQHSAST